MAKRGINFSEEAFNRTRAAVLRVEQAARNPIPVRPQGFTPAPRAFLEGVLDGDLAAATDLNTPTTATLSVWRLSTAGVMADSGEDVTVTNRDPLTSASAGDYLQVMRAVGEWRPSAAATGSGHGAFNVIKASATPFAVPTGRSVLVMGYPVTLGSAIAITLPAGAKGQEVIIYNAETPGIFGRTVNVTYRTGTGSAVADTLLAGSRVRLMYTGTVLGGGDDDWYFVGS